MTVPKPEITVVLPVYNAMPYLDQAIDSILAQTMPDFQLAIYDDCSGDGSYERALERARSDSRIAITRGTRRLGPSGSAQAAANLATSEFVARMDADDIATPDRLELQLAVLKSHPQAVLVGSLFTMIDGSNRLIRGPLRGPTRGAVPPIAHASIVYRRAAFEQAGGYRDGTDYFEDQDFYRRMARIGDLLIIDKPLIGLRFAGQHARLRDDRLEVIERINQIHQRTAVTAGKPDGRDIAPISFYSVGVLAALGLERPRLLGLMAKRVRLDRPASAAAVMAFIALAELSPLLARHLNHLVNRLRSTRFGAQKPENQVRRWEFTPQ